MRTFTFVVDFADNAIPTLSACTNILGGTLAAVQFSDALVDLENITEQRDALLDALQRCRFDSLNMSFADLEVCRNAIALTTGATP